MQDLNEILWPALAPVAIAAAGVPLAAWLHRGEAGWRRAPAWLGLVLAATYAACHWGLRGWKGFPPGDVHDWMPFIALCAVPLLACASCAGAGWWQAGLRALLASGAAALLLHRRDGGWVVGEPLAWIAGLGLAWAAVLVAWERGVRAATPGTAVVGLFLAALWTSLALVCFGSMTHGQFAGMVAAPLGVVLVLAWWRPALWSDHGAATVAGLVLPGLWVLGISYLDLPRWAPPCLALAGCAPWLMAVPALRARAPWQRLLAVALASALAAAPVLVVGALASLKAAGGEPSYQ